MKKFNHFIKTPIAIVISFVLITNVASIPGDQGNILYAFPEKVILLSTLKLVITFVRK